MSVPHAIYRYNWELVKKGFSGFIIALISAEQKHAVDLTDCGAQFVLEKPFSIENFESIIGV